MRSLVSTVCNYGLYFRKPLSYLVIYLVEGNTVMDVARGYNCFQYKSILVTGSMCFVVRTYAG